MPRRAFRLLAALLIAVSTAAAQNLRRPPGASERAYAVKIGWPASAEKIGAALRSGYVAGHGGIAGSAGNAAFQSWLLLDRWCELLSRSEPDELARFFGRFIFANPNALKSPSLVFLPPGQAPPPELQPLAAGELRRFADDQGARDAAIAHILAADYRPAAGSLAEGLRPDFLAAMTADETFQRAFFTNFSGDDFAPAALKILQQIWVANPAKFAEYQNLALALALVRDQLPPAWWPHHQVNQRDVPRDKGTALERFEFWVKSNESQHLYNDLRQLSAEELKFVVDAPIAASELEWGEKNARFPRADFGRAFSSIDYRYERLENKAYTWNGGPYTLAAIQADGGICVDQAYFAMLSGKSRGLPTLYFTGQGTDGGHAWFGYLKGENRWDMNCGRYENQGYAVGEALDPQTWRPINDHELASLAENFRRTPEYFASQSDLAMARIFERAGEMPKAANAIDSAISVSPRNDLAWAAKGDFLDRTKASAEARRDFHEAALKQFSNNDDLKVVHQRALAEIARETGDEKSAGAMEGQIISQNRRTRSDLSVNAAAAQLSGLVDAKKFEDAMREYRNLLSRLGRTSGGNFFYEIVQPFVRSLARSGDIASARKASDLARAALKPERGSILDQDMDSLGADLARKPGDR